MQAALNITVDWENLDEGSPEERACFAALGITCNNHCLSEGRDGFVNRIRTEPFLSTYHLAEWLVWNWWRLRWESRSAAPDWAFAHRLTTIGGGYVWPNITIFSDGERTAFIAKPSEDRQSTAFRYISNYIAIVPSKVFENAIDRFILQVLGQLDAEGLRQNNLTNLWDELSKERRDRRIARDMKLEALLGKDPGEADQVTIKSLTSQSQVFGEKSIEELAADHAQGGDLLSFDGLTELARTKGIAGSPKNAVRLSATATPVLRDVPAWRLGSDAARSLRSQERLLGDPIENRKLVELAGVETSVLTTDTSGSNISFALDKNPSESQIVLRSRWETGRRFELARLIADRAVLPTAGNLHVATRSYTYRQKMQRSFAAELLCPFEALDDFLNGDYSLETQQNAAERFNVSERTVETLLLNHKRLDRDGIEEDYDAAT